MRRLREFLENFIFSAESDKWLAVFRIGLGVQIILYTLSLRIDWHKLLSEGGNALIGRDLTEAILAAESPLAPHVGPLVTLAKSCCGVGEHAALDAIWIVLLSAGICLALGLFCRAAAIVCWLLHLCVVKSGGLFSYGVDNFVTIGLFYLMLAPLPDRWSVDWKIRHGRSKYSQLLGFFRRILQLHLCLIYFFSGLSKGIAPGWWDGTNIWRALTRPPFNVIPAELIVRWKLFFPIAGAAVCLLELCYPLLIWPRKTRFPFVVAIIAMHSAIAATMGMYLFSLIMIILNVAAFGVGSLGARGNAGRNVAPAKPGPSQTFSLDKNEAGLE